VLGLPVTPKWKHHKLLNGLSSRNTSVSIRYTLAHIYMCMCKQPNILWPLIPGLSMLICTVHFDNLQYLISRFTPTMRDRPDNCWQFKWLGWNEIVHSGLWELLRISAMHRLRLFYDTTRFVNVSLDFDFRILQYFDAAMLRITTVPAWTGSISRNVFIQSLQS